MVGAKAKLPKTTLYVSPEAQVSGQTYKFSAWNGTFGKNKMPYAVWNNYDAKYFAIKHRLSLVNGVQTRQLIHWNQMYSMTCTL